jgi:hypothetical protein
MHRYKILKFTIKICLIKSAFVGEKNFNIIKMHGTIIKIISQEVTCVRVHARRTALTSSDNKLLSKI